MPATCRFWSKGICARNDRCKFLHEGASPAASTPTSPVSSSGGGISNSSSGGSHRSFSAAEIAAGVSRWCATAEALLLTHSKTGIPDDEVLGGGLTVHELLARAPLPAGLPAAAAEAALGVDPRFTRGARPGAWTNAIYAGLVSAEVARSMASSTSGPTRSHSGVSPGALAMPPANLTSSAKSCSAGFEEPVRLFGGQPGEAEAQGPPPLLPDVGTAEAAALDTFADGVFAALRKAPSWSVSDGMTMSRLLKFVPLDASLLPLARVRLAVDPRFTRGSVHSGRVRLAGAGAGAGVGAGAGAGAGVSASFGFVPDVRNGNSAGVNVVKGADSWTKDGGDKALMPNMLPLASSKSFSQPLQPSARRAATANASVGVLEADAVAAWCSRVHDILYRASRQQHTPFTLSRLLKTEPLAVADARTRARAALLADKRFSAYGVRWSLAEARERTLPINSDDGHQRGLAQRGVFGIVADRSRGRDSSGEGHSSSSFEGQDCGQGAWPSRGTAGVVRSSHSDTYDGTPSGEHFTSRFGENDQGSFYGSGYGNIYGGGGGGNQDDDDDDDDDDDFDDAD